MKINFFGLFSVEALYIMLGLCGITVIAIILAIIAIAKASSMKKKYKSFMEGSEGTSIEQLIKDNLEDFKQLQETSLNHKEAIKDIYDKMQYAFQKIGLVKYDAYYEMGGKLSFALCLLDKQNNGYLMNVMHSNTGSFAYIKEITHGKAESELGTEEEEALQQAIAGRLGDVQLSDKMNDVMYEDKEVK